jgi:hypothetical protein
MHYHYYYIGWMKKALLAAVLLLALLGITNPSLSAHEDAVLDKELGGLPAAGFSTGDRVVRTKIAEIVASRVGRRNYGLFSLTTISYADTLPASAPADLLTRTVGVGALSFVYLWSAM